MAAKSFAFGPHVLHASQRFLETQFSMAFVNLKPLVPGHVLVSPQRVAPRLSDLTDEEYSDLWEVVRSVSRVVEREYRAQGLNIAVQDGRAAGQSVPHVHVHILPRSSEDYENNDDVYQDIEAWDWRNHTVETPDSRKQNLKVPDDAARVPRTLEAMASEAAVLARLFQLSGKE